MLYMAWFHIVAHIATGGFPSSSGRTDYLADIPRGRLRCSLHLLWKCARRPQASWRHLLVMEGRQKVLHGAACRSQEHESLH